MSSIGPGQIVTFPGLTPSGLTLGSGGLAQMLGLGVYITPVNMARVSVKFSGSLKAANTHTITTSPYWGTGTAPANGDAQKGFTDGTSIVLQNITATELTVIPFHVEFVVGGLTINTAFWFDLSCAAGPSTTVVYGPVNVVIMEV